jgi:very-short-patch-repair endonuclease
MAVYQELRRAQEDLERLDSIGIAANVPIRLPGKTVDLLVTHQGRCGVIEVDGASHNRKRASDRSRDHLLEDSGVLYVARIDAVDTAQPEEVEAFVRRFLHKLA